MASPFPANIPPADATAFLRDKLALPTETWTDIWKGAHARAFVVAGANTEAIVTDFHQAVTRAIAEGQTLEQFRESFDEIVEKHGWSHTGSRGWRSRVIFETNTRMAYMAAKWKAFVENKLMRPFLRYVGILDDRIRPQHRSWHDTVLPVDDPWWLTHFPPNGWGCRCDVQSLSQRDLDRRGFRVQPEAPPIVMVSRPVRSKSGQTFVKVPKGIDPGFDYNVGVAGFGSSAHAGPGVVPLISPLPALAPGLLQAIMPKAAPVAPVVREEEVIRTAVDQVTREGASTLTDPAGTVIEIGKALVDSILASGDDVTPYLPLLRELMEEPQEIWVGFATHEASGKVELLRRYLRLVTLPDGEVLLVCDCAGREARSFAVSRIKEAWEPLRSGLRLYRLAAADPR